nr:hypothetical protein [Nocardioides daphniae]
MSSRAVAMQARPIGPAPTMATVEPGATAPLHTDLVRRGEDVGEQHGLLVRDRVRQYVQRTVGEGHPDELGLGPSTRCPRVQPPPFRHWPSRFWRQYEQRPHPATQETRPVPGADPGDAVAHLEDGADRLVAQDPPGSDLRTSPFRMCRSVPQMVTASTRTSASVGACSSGSGTDVQTRRPGPWNVIAFMGFSSPDGGRVPRRR